MRRASENYNGKGIENGIDVDNILRLLKIFKDNLEVSSQLKAALETIMAGASWSGCRINSFDSNFNSSCQRCGSPVEDDVHVFWQCPCNASIEEQAVQNTQYLCARAVKNSSELPSFWLRGLLPRRLTEMLPETAPSNDISIGYVNHSSMDWKQQVYCGDASGGKHTEHRPIRRVGVSVILANATGEFIFGIKCNLPGPIQTVGREGLLVLVVLARFLLVNSQLEYVGDNDSM